MPPGAQIILIVQVARAGLGEAIGTDCAEPLLNRQGDLVKG